MEPPATPEENHDDPQWEGLEEEEESAQICVRCMRPVSPRAYYCPHCFYAVNQMTPYLPFMNIWFNADFIGSAARSWKRPETNHKGPVMRIAGLLMLLSVLPLVAVYYLLAAVGAVLRGITRS